MGTERQTTRFHLDDLKIPVIQAPMAGGPSTPELASAVSAAGGLGFLAAGYKTATAMRTDMQKLTSLTDRPFGVNLFVPQPSVLKPDALQRYAGSLAADAERFGVSLGEPRHDDDDWDTKLEVLLDLTPTVVSFTFDALFCSRRFAASVPSRSNSCSRSRMEIVICACGSGLLEALGELTSRLSFDTPGSA